MEPSEAAAPNASTRTGPPGFGALSLPGRAAVTIAALVIVLAGVWHLGNAFFYVAPANTVKDEYGETIRDYMTPEFSRNWQLFAPNPPTTNTHVEVRAEFRREDGTLDTTVWVDMTGQDMDAVEHSLLPGTAPQTQLRRIWTSYLNTHDDEGNAQSESGLLAESYLHRIALRRLTDEVDLRDVERIQVRGVTTSIQPPAWTGETVSGLKRYRELEWWHVRRSDFPDDVRDDLPDEEAS
ncbi:DUF5819 family protein [Streptomyces sp. NBC_01803]|uniref:DUF5819 family protein n=1 Tax=Streptomyces sp. NBC_01803 TaxID=2975946 RepID=UPI002DDC6F58|nr:DUF5819 family protein [Streptomyces sp. NBC_01803]WSA43575.1 DUF5819 family protein [Streptomyces sp. NBC_01803]